MALAKLAITLRNADLAISRLQSHVTDSNILEPRFQYFIAEMVMLRLFSIFESSVAELAAKLAAGATYTNGSLPSLNAQANAVSGARGLFLNYGRTRPVQNLKWTKASFIKASVRFVIPDTEKFLFNLQAHGQTIEDMRRVRNHVAHRAPSTNQLYREVLRRAYGANVKVHPGPFLTSTRRFPTSQLDSYLASTRLILADSARGT